MANVVKRQQGVVLVMSLIMIVAITAVAVSLMSSSSLDLKITNAAQEREMAESELYGEVQKIIAEQSARGQASYFMRSTPQMANGRITFSSGDTANQLTNLNNGKLDLRCPRQFGFTEGVVCNMTRLETTIEYGTKSKHSVTVVTGVSQEMLSTAEVN